jgi:hypothetical protein
MAHEFSDPTLISELADPWLIVAWLVLVLFTLFTARRIIQADSQRKILDRGLLSVHSCAILWNAVVVAHFRALRAAGMSNDGMLDSYHGYTIDLANQATRLRDQLFDIHGWIQGRR